MLDDFRKPVTHDHNICCSLEILTMLTHRYLNMMVIFYIHPRCHILICNTIYVIDALVFLKGWLSQLST